MHTVYSFDSETTTDEIIKKARKMGIGVTITDHLDMNYTKLFPGKYEDFSIKDFHEEYEKLRSEDFLIGIECGMDPEYAQRSKEFTEFRPVDYVLGSVHTIRGQDAFRRQWYLNAGRENFYHMYFEFMLECLKTHPYIDSLGHIDYPARYAPYEKRGFRFHEFREGIVAVFDHLIQNGKAMELNLQRFNNPDFRDEVTEIYKEYKDRGGKYVTIGSDSHRIAPVGEGLKDAYTVLTDIGLTPVYFRNRKMELMKP